MARLFVALPIPDDVRAVLRSFCAGLPGAKWVRPENYHITLAFIGEVQGRAIHDVEESLGHIHAPAFPVRLTGLGTFETKGRVRALWAGVERTDGLMQLRQKVESRLKAADMEPEKRKFKPHVSLARFNGTPLSKIGAFLSGNNDFRAPTFMAEEFILYSSVLNEDGAIHTPEVHYPLITGYDFAALEHYA